jgi:hypothetical protein
MSSVTTESNQDRRPERNARDSGILDDPSWFLDRLDLTRGLGVFTRVRREALSAATFLDQSWNRGEAARCVAPISEIRAFQGSAQSPATIWHSAFCCSTLVANCLDAPGTSLALKEPMALMDLDEALRTAPERPDDRLVSAVFSLLGRGFTPAERVVIKPSNTTNAMISAVAANTAGPMLLLYSSCRDFILSVARGGGVPGGVEDRRRFVRDLMARRVLNRRPGVRWRPEELYAMTDLQIAALVWHAQMGEFRAVARALEPRRARSLDCDLFLADPRRGLDHLDRFLALGLGPARTEAIASGPKLSHHAKQPHMAFGAVGRRRAWSIVEIELGSSLGDLIEWSYRVCPETPRGDPVGAPLFTLDA